MICPNRGCEPETQHRLASVSRWATMSPEQRSAETSRIRRLGTAKAKRVARRSNDQAEP